MFYAKILLGVIEDLNDNFSYHRRVYVTKTNQIYICPKGATSAAFAKTLWKYVAKNNNNKQCKQKRE